MSRIARIIRQSPAGITLLLALAACAPGEVLPPGTELWTRQFGTSSAEQVRGAAVDSGGNVYLAGSTFGSLAGVSAGGVDAFVRKFDSAGSALWTDQFGTADADVASAVAVDQIGNILVVGTTTGTLGPANLGNEDLFVRKYTPDATVLWTAQFGTSGNDIGAGLAVDASSNVLVVGHVVGDLEGASPGGLDAVVRKYSPDGEVLWTRQFGTSANDTASSVAVDAAGNVFVAGSTAGALAAPQLGLGDGFVRKYNASGDLLWTRQFGTSGDDFAAAVASAAGNVYVGGRTTGDLEGPSAGASDGYVRAYDAQGDFLWGRQIGTAQFDAVYAVSADATGGGLTVGGLTEGALVGVNAGLEDAYVVKLDAQGATLWLRQFGTPQDETVSAAAGDAAGNPVVVGITSGALSGANAGQFDAYARKYCK